MNQTLEFTFCGFLEEYPNGSVIGVRGWCLNELFFCLWKAERGPTYWRRRYNVFTTLTLQSWAVDCRLGTTALWLNLDDNLVTVTTVQFENHSNALNVIKSLDKNNLTAFNVSKSFGCDANLLIHIYGFHPNFCLY